MQRKVVWSLVASGAAVIAAVAARKGIQEGWRRWADEEPPLNPMSPETDWKQAALWAAASGVVVGMARLFARRSAASGWLRATGRLPPL